MTEELEQLLNLETAIDSQHCPQVRDLSRFPTAAQFTKWVTNAIAPNTYA